MTQREETNNQSAIFHSLIKYLCHPLPFNFLRLKSSKLIGIKVERQDAVFI